MDEEQRPKKKFNLSTAKQMHTKGKTYKEIAEHFGTTEQRVKNAFSLDNKAKREAEETKRKPGRPPGSKNKETLAKEKMLTNWQNSSLAPQMREDKADLNRAAGYFVAQCWKLGETVDHNNIDSLYRGLENYIALCTQCGMPMLVKTCHLALGINAHTISRWRTGRQRADDARYKEFVEVLDAVINAGIESAAAAGSIDRVLTIWWQKAHMGMTENHLPVQETEEPLGQRVNSEDIVKKYGGLPD